MSRLFPVIIFSALACVSFGCAENQVQDDTSDWPEADAKRFDEAAAFASNGAFTDARKIYSELSKSHPESALVKNNLGDTLMRMGELDAAEREFKSAILLDNENALYHYNLGNLLLKMGDGTQALWAFGRARSLDPKNPAYAWGLGRAHQARGYKPEAERAFLEALQLKADYEPAIRSLAISNYEAMHYAEALGYFRKLITKHQREESLYFYCSHCLWNLREYENAIKLMQRFLDSCPKASPERRKIAESFVEKVGKNLADLKILKEQSSASEPPEEINRSTMDSMMQEYKDALEKSPGETPKPKETVPAPDEEPPSETKEPERASEPTPEPDNNGGPDDLKSLKESEGE